MVDSYRVEQWLHSRSPSVRCPCCGERNFEVGNILAMTNSIQDDTGRVNYLNGFPLVVVMCHNCAYVMFFAAKQMGMIKGT